MGQVQPLWRLRTCMWPCELALYNDLFTLIRKPFILHWTSQCLSYPVFIWSKENSIFSLARSFEFAADVHSPPAAFSCRSAVSTFSRHFALDANLYRAPLVFTAACMSKVHYTVQR